MDTFAKRIFVIGLILRLIPALLSYDLPIGLDDMFQYDMLARSIRAGEGYRWYSQEDIDLINQYFEIEFLIGEYDPRGVLTSFRPPGYPAFLALVYFFSGLQTRFYIARIAQAFLGALVVLLTYLLARRLFPEEERIARFASIAVAVYPMLVVYPLALATENTFIPLLLGSVLMLLRAADTRRWQDYALTGLLLGLASLTRSVVTAAIPLVLLWVWFGVKDRKGAVIIPAFVLLLTLPWAIRNTLLFDRPTYIESALGYQLYLGYHPESSGTFQYGISLDLLPYLDDAERDEIGTEKTLGFIRDDPGRIPYLMVSKLGHFFGLERRALSYFYSNNFFGAFPLPLLVFVFLLFTLPFVVLTVFGAIGLPFMKINKERGLALLVMFGHIFPHVLILAEPRFHLALAPFFAIFAGYGWAKRREIWAGAFAPEARPKLILAVLLLGLLFLNWGLELNRDAGRLAALFGPEGNMARFDY